MGFNKLNTGAAACTGIARCIRSSEIDVNLWTLPPDFEHRPRWPRVPRVPRVTRVPRLHIPSEGALTQRWDFFDDQLETKIWLVVLEHVFFKLFFPYLGNFIIPTDFHIFQRGRYTTNQKILSEKTLRESNLANINHL